jgi:hypothetical protein
VTSDILMNAQVQWRPAIYRRVGPPRWASFVLPLPPLPLLSFLASRCWLDSMPQPPLPSIATNCWKRPSTFLLTSRISLQWSWLWSMQWSQICSAQPFQTLYNPLSKILWCSMQQLMEESGPCMPQEWLCHLQTTARAQGNAVALTMTLNDEFELAEFGSKFVSPSTSASFLTMRWMISRPLAKTVTQQPPLKLDISWQHTPV